MGNNQIWPSHSSNKYVLTLNFLDAEMLLHFYALYCKPCLDGSYLIELGEWNAGVL